jgi:glycosyltransferase involved in cell wall biosynthesis
MRWTPKGFADRTGVAFIAGWASGPKSPNIDGMQWFAREVWPRVLARLPEARLQVTGGNPPVEVRRFACDSIEFVGRVEDLNAYYADLRVVVVPNRFGAGVKNKTIEALQSGIPTVSTAVGAEGVPIPGFVDGLSGKTPRSPSYLTVTDDPGAFAERVVTLLSDEPAWEVERSLLRQQCEAWSHEQSEHSWTRIIDRVAPPTALELSTGRGVDGES